MNKKWCAISCGTIIGIVIIVGIMSTFWTFGVINQEVSLRNKYHAQFKIRETTMDNMIKTLKNEYKVTDDFAKNFVLVVQEQSKGRTGGNGSVLSAKAINESEKLGISSDMYRMMANTIEGKLAEYKRSQDTLVDIWREHNTYCSKIPYRWIVGGKIKDCPEPIMITSDTVQDAVKTGTLDDNILN